MEAVFEYGGRGVFLKKEKPQLNREQCMGVLSPPRQVKEPTGRLCHCRRKL